MPLLLPDETWCERCRSIFINGDAYEAHRPKDHCLDPQSVGLEQFRNHKATAVWRFKGRFRTRKLRRSPAQAAFERLADQVLCTAGKEGLADARADIEKVRRVLERR